MSDPFYVYSALRGGLVLVEGQHEVLWELARHQSQAFNVGVDAGLAGLLAEGEVPSEWDAY